MALNFPISPTLNQVYGNWIWDGVKWTTQTTSPAASNNVGRNLLHNPLMNIAQRGVGPFNSFAAGLTLDRWNIAGVTDVFTVMQGILNDTDRARIGDESAINCLSNQFTGTASGYVELQQRIEDVRRLAGKTITLSFYAASSVPLKLGINVLQYMGSGGSPSTDVSVLTTGLPVQLSNTWGRYSVTITMPSLAGKTLGTNFNHGTWLRIAYTAGTAVNQYFGNIGVQTGAINIWGMQLEIGSVMTPLEKPDYNYDVGNCQRFFWAGQMVFGGYSAMAITAQGTITLPVMMRTNPTIIVTGNYDVALTSPTQSLLNGGTIFFGGLTPAGSSGWTLNRTFTASADL